MATDKGKEQEKFDFTSEGEELDYFNLDQTILHKKINRVQNTRISLRPSTYQIQKHGVGLWSPVTGHGRVRLRSAVAGSNFLRKPVDPL